MSDDLDMAKACGNYQIFLQVCSVFHAVETSELRVELGPAEQLNQNGDHVGSERRDILRELMDELTSLTQHSDPVHRRAAVTALGEAALCAHSFASEVEASLINLMPHEDEETFIAVVNALGRMASRGTPRLVKSLIRQLADAPPNSDLLISEILVALQHCDPLAASQAVPTLVGIVNHSNSSEKVRIAGCATLGAIGEEAIEAIPDLLKALKNISEVAQVSQAEYANATASAIARIDREGLHTVAAAETLEDLERVRQLLLASSDATDRHLASSLTRQIAALKNGPPAGRRRAYLKDLVTDIFGRCPSNGEGTQSAEQWTQSKTKNVTNWIAARILPGMRIDSGTYDVDVAAVQALRERNFGSATTDRQ